jgi:hypothetical protein
MSTFLLVGPRTAVHVMSAFAAGTVFLKILKKYFLFKNYFNILILK